LEELDKFELELLEELEELLFKDELGLLDEPVDDELLLELLN
jgi:hypothetical protein